MPYIKGGASSSSSEDEQSPVRAHVDAQDIVTDDEYKGATVADNGELPLSEQLEPIAVVGMGMFESFHSP